MGTSTRRRDASRRIEHLVVPELGESKPVWREGIWSIPGSSGAHTCEPGKPGETRVARAAARPVGSGRFRLVPLPVPRAAESLFIFVVHNEE